MRPLDRLFDMYRDGTPAIRRLALRQMDDLTLDFEAADCMAFLALVEARESPPLASQARRTRHIMGSRHAVLQDRSRRAPTSESAGTWTTYNIDRREINNLKRLGIANSQDLTTTEVEQLRRSGCHILARPIGILMERCATLPASVLPAAIAALGQVGTPEAADRIVACVREDQARYEMAARALAEVRTENAFRGLADLVARTSDPEVAGEMLPYLTRFPAQAQECRDILSSSTGKQAAVRIGAASALAGLERHRALPLLLPLLRDPVVEVVLWTLESLARLGDPAAAPDVIRCLHDSNDPWVVRMATACLGRADTHRSFLTLKDCLGSPDSGVRTLAIEGLIKLGASSDELIGYVRPCLEDPSPDVVASAVLAMAPYEAVASGRALRKLVTDSTSSPARRHGAWCLGYLHGERSLDVLAHLAQHDADASVRLAAVKAIAKYPPESAMATLLPLLEHSSSRIRQVAARVAAHFQSTVKLAPWLLRISGREADPIVKAELLRAAARHHGRAFLVSGVQKMPSDVAVACLEVMDCYPDIQFLPQLELLVGDPRPQVRALAARALWNQGEISVAKRLALQIASGDDESVAAGIQALGGLLDALRRLECSDKNRVLLFELKAHLRSQDYLSSAARGDAPVVPLASPDPAQPFGGNTGIWSVQELQAAVKRAEPSAAHERDLAGSLPPYEGVDPYIFLSYKHEDYRRIHPHLEHASGWGHRIWYDRGIPGGAEWDALVEVKIQSCRMLLLFASQASIGSKWVRREVKFADAKGKPILCVMLEPVEFKFGLDMLLTQYQMIDASRATFTEEFRKAMTFLDPKEPHAPRAGE